MKLPPHAGAGSAADPIEVSISLTGGVFIKKVAIARAGTIMPQYSHAYDHTSLLVLGAMRVWADDVDLGEFTGVVPIAIRAGVHHRMLTLVDDTVFCCIHSVGLADDAEILEEARTPEPDPLPEPDSAGFVVTEEPWADFWRDGQALFREHEAAIGGARQGVPITINTGLIDKLDAVGAAHIMTVRSNGRLFGYLCTMVGPAIENAALLVGTTTAFYVSPAARGYGPRLLRATVESLRRKGVHEVIMRAGVRGDGPRLGALYRRMGARPDGEMFSLMLREV